MSGRGCRRRTELVRADRRWESGIDQSAAPTESDALVLAGPELLVWQGRPGSRRPASSLGPYVDVDGVTRSWIEDHRGGAPSGMMRERTTDQIEHGS